MKPEFPKNEKPSLKKRGAEDFVVLTKTYDLLLWYVQQIGRFPWQLQLIIDQSDRP